MATSPWESERQAASVYVERRRRARLSLRDAVFQRINAHANFLDHDHARRRQQLEALAATADTQMGMEMDASAAGAHDKPDDDHDHDLALDFLGDVDADDMRTLLATAASPPSSTTVVATTTPTTPTAPAVGPLAMPTHLLSTASASTVPASVAGVAVGVSLGEDVGVAELMDELEIDVQSLAASAAASSRQPRQSPVRKRSADESKTEEGTPPRHVREQRVQGANATGTRAASKPAASNSLAKSWQDVFDPEAAAASEMEAWVTGQNDPEVLKRRESLRGDTKRKPTKRLGAETYEYQTSIRRVVKYHAREGESSSNSSSDESNEESDFSPQEVIEVDEEEEDEPDGEPFSDTELIPDDVVDEEHERRRRNTAARRRIRQHMKTKMTIRKNPPPLVKTPEPKKSKKIKPPASRPEPKLEDAPKRKIKESTATKPKKERASLVEPREEPLTIDLMSDSDRESALKRGKGSSLAVDEKAAREKAASTVEDPEKVVFKLKVTPRDLLDLQGKQDALREDMEGLPSAHKSQPSNAGASEPDAPERPPADTANVVRQEPSETLPTFGAPVPPSRGQSSSYGGADYGAGEGGGAGFPPDDEDDLSDTGTLDLNDVDMEDSEADTAGAADSSIPGGGSGEIAKVHRGSPTSAATGDESNTLQPVEPEVKMSPPRHSTPPSKKQALEPTSQTEDGASASVALETETVDFDEVASDVDFGSDESADFDGDDGIDVGGDRGGDSDEEAEFDQFFSSGRKQKRKQVASTKPAPVDASSSQADASPVKLIRLEEPSPVTKRQSPATQDAASPTRTGSNGLRKVPNVNTTRVAEGKFKHTRRAIQLLDDDMKTADAAVGSDVHDPRKNLISRSRLVNNAGPPPLGDAGLGAIRPLQLRHRVLDDKGAPTDTRYLGYDRPQPKPTIKDQYADAAKEARERFDKKKLGGGGHPPLTAAELVSKSALHFDATTVGSGAGLLKPLDGMQTSAGVYLPPREPQIDIYQATGASSQFEDEPLSLSLGHKRPRKLAKEIEAAKKQGIDVRKGIPQELDPKAEIPKKSAAMSAKDRSAPSKKSSTTPARSIERDREHSSPVRKFKKSKSDKSDKSTKDTGKRSIYGPQPTNKKSRRASEDSRHSKDRSSADDKWRGRSRSRSRDRDRDRTRSDDRSGGGRGGRGSDRVKERRRSRDYNRDRERDRPSDRSRCRQIRSVSPPSHRSSHKWSNHDDRFERKNYPRSRSRSHSHSRSRSPSQRDAHRRDEGRLDSVTQNGREDPRQASLQSYKESVSLARTMDGGRDILPSKPEHPAKADGKLDSLDDCNGSDIADSDFEIRDAIEDDEQDGDRVNVKSFDIRFDLSDIEIDHEQRERMLYIHNIPPECEEGDLIDRCRPFGIAENRDIGCLAVDVFLCQRTHRPRGDARVVFLSPEAARRAAAELDQERVGNANILLSVRMMDRETLRILTAQFDLYRDTWMCSNESCRAETSTWTRFCGSCQMVRKFPHSHVRVQSDDWLCSICFSNNLNLSAKCSGCSATLPPRTSYSSSSHSRTDRRSF